MEQRGMDIPRRAFQCLVFLLGIFRTRGSVPNPQTMIPQSPKAFAPINHASAPFLPSSPPTFAAKEHKMLGSAIPPQRSQVLNTFHNLCHDLASSIVITPSTLVRCGTPVGEVQGKPSNGAPLTLPHAAAPSPSVFPLIPQDVPPTVPRIAPSTVRMPGAKTFNGPMMPPMIAPTNNSHFNDSFPILSPMPRDSNNTRTPSVSHPLPPEGRIAQSPQPAGKFSVPGHKDGKIEGIPASAPFSVSPSSATSGSLHSPPPLHQHVRIPKFKRDPILKHVVSPAPLPYFGRPVFSLAPVNHSPSEVPKNARRNIAPWHNAEGPEANPAPLPQPPMLNNKNKPYAPSPSAEGSFVNHAPMHPHIEISKKPYFPPDQAPSSGKSATPVSSPTTPHTHNRWPIYYPAPSPRSQPPLPQPILLLPPPPPNLRCGPIMCQEPLVNPLPGSPCTCVMPIKVGLRLSVALYTFFPLVSKFAQEIASGIFVKQSQVRIMGANAASEDTEKTIVLIDLVPLGRYFDKTTVFLSYEKFWHKQVKIQVSYFGDYDVLYVLYPGLPPSPPVPPAYIISEGKGYGSDNNARGIRPLGVDVRKQKRIVKLSGSLITIIFLSAVILLVLIFGAVWFLLSRNWKHSDLPASRSQSLHTPSSKFAAARAAPIPTGTRPNSASISFNSSIATYTGSTKGFSLADIENMTNKFDDLRIIGEGGFGRVYKGTLVDGMKVAVKALKRDDKQGEREFLAEVEMLGRLHHRNLVKLIGICAEENTRCLIYELIPNGSVESHLHGADKDISPLDWNARMKIALGAARGLAYLHEDSSPRVIHRDFKSSNILLEHDNTPKVSDFGLAREAMDEQNEHISTRVMGTFGYVAPEYAMTGHLLVKSDVYSYGVVLLELLTGRKPVDMLRSPGQENLVSWARPLLTKPEGLARIIDPTLGALYPRDSAAKVAAIASMCVEPEVSHRPFMGEVVQALKLVCDESDECRHSGSCSTEGSSIKDCPDSTGMLYAVSAAHAGGDASGLFGMHSGSGPLRTGRSRHFWQRFRGLASGSESEHWATHRFRSRSEHRWP